MQDKILITDDIIHECYKIMNNLNEKHSYEIMIRNSADQMGINVKELEKAIQEKGLYILNEDTQQYILKDHLVDCNTL